MVQALGSIDVGEIVSRIGENRVYRSGKERE